MKKNKLRICISFLGVFILTSCGYSLKEIYDGDSYNEVNFSSNFFSSWDKRIDYRNDHNIISDTTDTIILDPLEDSVFTSVNDASLKSIVGDDLYNSYDFDVDDTDVTKDNKLSFSQHNKLSRIDSSFKYGFLSRLYDGQIHCNGGYEKVRVQLKDSNDGKMGGFSQCFSKELFSVQYLAMSFKMSFEFRRKDDSHPELLDIEGLVRKEIQEQGLTVTPSTINHPLVHKVDMDLNLSFYLKNETGFTRVPTLYHFDQISSNTPESLFHSNYVFFGFNISRSFSEVNFLKRCSGISLEYTFNDPLLSALNNGHTIELESGNPSSILDCSNLYQKYFKNQPLEHSMLLYEIMFPNSIWH